MFTGIVEELGTVATAARGGRVARLEVRARATVEETAVGGSLAVNGACLTIVERRPDGFVFELGPETLARTTLGRLQPGDPVNLERPLRFGGALGGHLVLGHVDGVGTVEDVTRVESTTRMRVALPGRELEPLLIPQGSVAVDGVSLTVAALGGRTFEGVLIPPTLPVTPPGRLAPGPAGETQGGVIGEHPVRTPGPPG